MPVVDHGGDLFPEEECAGDVLKRTASIRIPIFERGKTTEKERLQAYEDHMILVSYWRAALVADRLRCWEDLDAANDEWYDLQTDTDFAGKTSVSNAQREREKRAEDPELFKRRRALTRRVELLTDEVARMDQEARTCSRIHTFVTGT